MDANSAGKVGIKQFVADLFYGHGLPFGRDDQPERCNAYSLINTSLAQPNQGSHRMEAKFRLPALKWIKSSLD